MSVYPNDKGFWIIQVLLNSVDAEEGLIAYMNILTHGNTVVRKWKLTKVVEHWNITPGDGNIYFARTPPFMQHLYLACCLGLNAGCHLCSYAPELSSTMSCNDA